MALAARSATAGLSARRRAAAPVRSVAARAQAAAALPQQKLRIKLKAYTPEPLTEACDKILSVAASTDAVVSGPVPLPTRRRIYCVLRSPHVNKDSREHFQIKTHQRLLDIKDPSAQTIDALMGLDLPAGVDIEVRL
mmetsp:Transcript_10788/g.37470  ORF Transcript_10788/g.37470 Transcript_10788/m.37470 type:complete len:137 (-) Transcript_10788:364-774(-)